MGIVGTAVGMLMMVYGLSCGLLVDTMYEWTFEASSILYVRMDL